MDVEQAVAAICNLIRVLRSARTRGRRGKLPLDDPKAAALETRAKAERAVGALETALDLTRRARKLADAAHQREERLAQLLVGERKLGTAVRTLTTAREDVADAERGLPGQLAALPSAIDQALQLAKVAATRTESLPLMVSEASEALDDAHHSTAEEFLPLLGRWLGTLAPIDFLRRWVGALSRVCSPLVAVLVVVALIAIAAWIALEIVDVKWFLVLGIAAALFFSAMVLAPRDDRMWAAVVAVVAVAVAGIAGLTESLEERYAAGVIGVSLLTIWLTAGAMSRWSSPKAVAWILFAAIAFWSGALGFLRERGSEPELEVVLVKSSSSDDAFQGFFLGRTSDHVYLASAEDSCHDDGCRSVLAIGDEEAGCVVFGPREPVDNAGQLDGDQLTEFVETASPCEPDSSEADDDKPTRSTTHSTRNLSLDFDLDVAPRRSVVIRRPRRDLSLDFDFNASPRLSLFSGPSQTRTRPEFAGDVLFPFEDDRLTLGARRRLQDVSRRIRRARPTWVYLYGHADEKGTPDANWRLSDRRARAVRRALVRRRAVNRTQVLTGSFGERSPAVCGRGQDGFDDPASRVYNRRVEIYTERPARASGLHCDD